MFSKKELIPTFERIHWAENEMRTVYASFNALADETFREALNEIEADEFRHLNMVEGFISIDTVKPLLAVFALAPRLHACPRIPHSGAITSSDEAYIVHGEE